MQALRILFWIVPAILLTIFAVINWEDVTVTVWNDTQLIMKLPYLIAFSFLIGLLPAVFYYRLRIAMLRRDLRKTRDDLDARPVPPPPPSATRDGF